MAAMGHVVLITGAAGYVGTMLVRAFAARPDVAKIVALDKEPVPDLIKDEPKMLYIQSNTADGSWQAAAANERPDIVIHAAWQIRMLYGHNDVTWKWNVDGSRAVFDFAFKHAKRLVHFSTAAIYGAYKDNTFEHRFKETEPMREEEYLYGVEKRKAEEILSEMAGKGGAPLIAIIRPAAITGPRGRFMRIRFGLQSALSGQLKGGVYGLISALTAMVPATSGWVRQFIHEDDIVRIVEKLSFDEWRGSRYEIYNATPDGRPVYAPDMAKAVNKMILPVTPWMVRIAYFFFWHLTRGVVPTAPGSWRFYSYPIVMSGEKLKTQLGYECEYESFDAFRYTDGVYESFVPEEVRRHRGTVKA